MKTDEEKLEEAKGILNRKLEDKAFKDAAIAIEGGKQSNSLVNPEEIQKLVDSFRGKTSSLPTEIIVTSAIFLDLNELNGVIETLKDLVKTKMHEYMVKQLKGASDIDLLKILASLTSLMKDE